MLQPGDKAPDLNLPDQDGNVVSLKTYRGRRVCIYFYPKADTPGCTTQSCLLRDVIADGSSGDVGVIGISPDKSAKLKKFDQKYELGFPLLADTEHLVAEAVGVWKEKMLYGKKYMGIERSAFLIDPKGKIEKAWYKVSPKDTPVVLLEALEALGARETLGESK
jgi:thioredoxin-dependent peroxiredoxin